MKLLLHRNNSFENKIIYHRFLFDLISEYSHLIPRQHHIEERDNVSILYFWSNAVTALILAPT